MRSAYQATKQVARQWAQPRAVPSPVQTAQQIDRWNAAPGQHVLQTAAIQTLAQDQAIRQQSADEVQRILDRTPDAPRVSDEVRQQLAAAQDPSAEWYARSRLGYRPGDPQARDPARRRDQSDQAARWEDVLPGYDAANPSQEHQDEINRLRLQRAQFDAPGFFPADAQEEQLYRTYQRQKAAGRTAGAADLAMWRQRISAGAPPTAAEWADQFPEAQLVSPGPNGSGQASSTDRAMRGFAYQQAFETLASFGAQSAAGQAGYWADKGTAAVLSDAAGTAVGAIGKIGQGAAAGSAFGPVGTAIGAAAGAAAAVSELPTKIMEWSEALVESKRDLSLWSGQLQEFFAEKEIRGWKRDILSAESTGSQTAALGRKLEDLKDELRPIKDEIFKASAVIAEGVIWVAKISDNIWKVKEAEVGSIPWFIKKLSEISDKLNPSADTSAIQSKWAEAWRNLDIPSSRVP